MAFEDGSKKELQKVGLEISNRFPLTRTTLASMESLSLPLVLQTPSCSIFQFWNWPWICFWFWFGSFAENRFRKLFFLQICNVRSARRG